MARGFCLTLDDTSVRADDISLPRVDESCPMT
jgi:hypothetical protein